MRQVLVRLFLPAGRPDELEAIAQPRQALARLIGDAVDDPVDRVEAPWGRPIGWEAEHADDSVDVDEEERAAGLGVTAIGSLVGRPALGRIVTMLLHLGWGGGGEVSVRGTLGRTGRLA